MSENKQTKNVKNNLKYNFKPNRAVIDTNTKEVLFELDYGDRIVKKAQEEKSKINFSFSDFAKINSEEFRLLLPDLENNEKAVLLSLFPYIRYETGIIQYPNGKDIGHEDIMRICNVSEATMYRVIGSLIKKDLLYKGKNSKNIQFYINPWLISRGNTISKVLKTMFKNYCIRSKGGVQWKNLK